MKFVAFGEPATQGSMRAFVSKATQRAIAVPMMAKKLKAWRSTVAQAARSAMHPWPAYQGLVKVRAQFVLERPKKPKRECPRQDLDKLTRAIGDALTGVCYLDDAQVCVWEVSKTYGSPARAEVEVTEL